MIRNKVRLIREPSSLQIFVMQPDLYDEQVLCTEGTDPLYLEMIQKDPQNRKVVYDTTGLVSLSDFLKQVRFEPAEDLLFLHGVLAALNKAGASQPVVPLCDAIYLSRKGETIRFARAPLAFEAWMKRKEDYLAFMQELLMHLNSQAYEAAGLLFQGSLGRLSLEEICEECARLIQTKSRRRFSFHNRPRTYYAHKPVYPLDEPLKDEPDRNPFAAPADRPSELEQAIQSVPVHPEESIRSADQMSSGSKKKSRRTGRKKSRLDRQTAVHAEPLVFEEHITQPVDDVPSVMSNDQPVQDDFFADLQLAQNEQPSEPSSDLKPSETEKGDEFDALFASFLPSKTPGFSGQTKKQQEEAIETDEAEKQQPMQISQTDNAKLSKLQEEFFMESNDHLYMQSSASANAALRVCEAPASPLQSRRESGTDAEQLSSFALQTQNLVKTGCPMAAQEEEQDSMESTVLVEEFIPAAWLESDGVRFDLECMNIEVGRLESSDISLIDPTVSQKHARIICANGRWYVQDLRSTNGTWIGQKKVIRRMRLKDGMVLRFGSREAIFHE